MSTLINTEIVTISKSTIQIQNCNLIFLVGYLECFSSQFQFEPIIIEYLTTSQQQKKRKNN